MRAALALAACLALPACAAPKYGVGDSEDVYSREGAYVAAAATAGLDAFHPSSPFDGSGNSGVGAGIRVGYRGPEGVAIELFAEDERGYSLDSPYGSTSVEFRNLGFNGKVYFAEGRVQPYGQIGLGWTRVLFSERTKFNTVTGSDFDVPYTTNAFLVRAGAGVDVYLSKTIALFVEANYDYLMSQPSKDTRLGELNHFQGLAGVLIRF